MDYSTATEEITDSPKNTYHIEILTKYQKYSFIARINTQSTLPAFYEFSLILNTYKFDIVAVSETRIKDNHHQLNYDKMP